MSILAVTTSCWTDPYTAVNSPKPSCQQQYEIYDSAGRMTPEYVADVRSVLAEFLAATGIQPDGDIPPFDDDLMKSSGDSAIAHGFDEEFIRSSQFQRYLRLGTFAKSAYGHLKNRATQKWICLYTAFIIYFDDILEKDASMVREFQQRFLAGRPQENTLLDQYAAFVRKAWIHFHPACANLIVTSILDFVTGLLIDAEHPSIEVHKRAVNYPRWMRTLNGGSRAFAFFIFPPEIPLEHYIQVISDTHSIIDDVNDLLSFYKEEMRGETTNQVSLLAQLAGKTKLEALRQLSRGSIERIRCSRDVLSKHPDAHDIYVRHFLPGYVRYYITEKRYKLGDLDLA